MIDAVCPPPREAPALVIGAHADEAEVVDAVLEAGDLVVPDRIEGGFRRCLVRGQDDVTLVERFQQVVKAGKQHHVGIEIQHAFHVRPRQQLLQHERLDRGGQLDDGVEIAPALAVRDVELVDRQHLVDRLDGKIHRTPVPVGKRQHDLPLGMMLANRGAQLAHLGQGVDRSGSEDDGFHGASVGGSPALAADNSRWKARSSSSAACASTSGIIRPLS